MSGKVMQVVLPDDLAQELSASVARGEYPSESEAMSVDELRRLWQEGIDSGPGRGLTIEEIKVEARRRRAAG
jgi:antitoxin ParD1/3/4